MCSRRIKNICIEQHTPQMLNTFIYQGSIITSDRLYEHQEQKQDNKTMIRAYETNT